MSIRNANIALILIAAMTPLAGCTAMRDKDFIPDNAGVIAPAPQFAGRLVTRPLKYGQTKPSRHYFDERGWSNSVLVDTLGNEYFNVRNDGPADAIYRNPDGSFATIAAGRAANKILAAEVIGFARNAVSDDLKKVCVDTIRNGLLDPSSLVLTRPLALDEEATRLRPRGPIFLKASITARTRGGNITPTSLHCYATREGNQLKMVNAFLLNN